MEIRIFKVLYRRGLLTYVQLMEQHFLENVGRDTDYHSVSLFLRKSVEALKHWREHRMDLFLPIILRYFFMNFEVIWNKFSG